MAASYRSLIVFPAEYIHFIQYILFFIVAYVAMGHRWWPACIISLLAGIIDEALQTGLHEMINLRDVGLNAIGVAWGGLIVHTWREHFAMFAARK